MTVGNLYQGAPLIINTATTLSGMQRVAYNPNIGLVKPASDGRAVRCLVTIGKKAPVVEATTLNIAQALALMAATGELPYLALTSLKWIERKVDPNAPKFLATSVHEQGAATAGTMFFAGLEATPNEPAVMSLMSLLTSADGDTDPVAWTQVAAPSDPNTIAPYFVDSVAIDGTDCTDLVSASVQPTVDVATNFGTKPYPRLARPRSVDWFITIRHNDATFMRVKGDKAGAIQLVLKAANTGGPTRGSAAQTWTVTGLIHTGGNSQSGAAANSEFVTIVNGRHDGTNQPATWANA